MHFPTSKPDRIFAKSVLQVRGLGNAGFVEANGRGSELPAHMDPVRHPFSSALAEIATGLTFRTREAAGIPALYHGRPTMAVRQPCYAGRSTTL